MFIFTTGDLLKSEASALVNTVNCEGYMGKGIAYQFKLQYPEMNKEYIKVCKKHELTPGKLHCYQEKDKMIINFPTKDKWREKSKIEYIEKGLDDLIGVISDKKITSIAIPPLGSGNGGLNWMEVKKIITEKLKTVSENMDIYIYEPSLNYTSISTAEPKLSLSALILMNIKFNLDKDKFKKIYIQKTAYFMNILSHTKYFHFIKGDYGPFDHSIEIVSRNIKEFQNYHGLNNTEDAYKILMQKLISKNIEEKLTFYLPFIKRASDFANTLSTTKDIEGAGTSLFIIENNPMISENDIINNFKMWSDEKAHRFSENDIKKSILEIEQRGFIEKTFLGYKII